MSEWISVKDRLPTEEERGSVLFLRDGKWENKGVYKNYEEDVWRSAYGEIYIESITHWSPIVFPSLPKEELKLESGKVYEDIQGWRVLIIKINSEENKIYGCHLDNGLFGEKRLYLSDGSTYYGDEESALPERSPKLIKLSENQFPGAI